MSTSLQTPTLPAAVRPSTILLIDDDPFEAYARKYTLERHFRNIERVPDAAHAFIRLEDPGFAAQVALVIVGLHMPGPAGPSIVSELSARMPNVPILVIGREQESAGDYASSKVRFVERHASTNAMLTETCELMGGILFKVA